MRVPELVVSVDASFRGAGVVSLIRGQQLVVEEIIATTPALKTFQEITQASYEISKRLRNACGLIATNDSQLVFELPPTFAQYSSGLYLLDGYVVRTAIEFGMDVFGCSAQAVKSVLGGRAKTKKDAIAFVQRNEADLLNLTNKETLNTVYQSHNLCESLIILMAYSYFFEWGNSIFPSFGSLSDKRPRFVDVWRHDGEIERRLNG
jgi:hypothetical protein